MSDFVPRLERELEELRIRSAKLAEFMSTDEYYALKEVEKYLMRKQIVAMGEYADSLAARLSLY